MRRRSKNNKSFIFNDFYCLSCGSKSFSLPRSAGKGHEAFHRKRLYCPNCKREVNHIECRNDEEAYEFRLAYEMGEFVAEAVDSMLYIEEENFLNKKTLSYA